MMIMGAVCDCQGWDAIVDFMEDGTSELLAMFEFSHGISSANTLRRGMGL
jgi:hypothetical protein